MISLKLIHLISILLHHRAPLVRLSLIKIIASSGNFMVVELLVATTSLTGMGVCGSLGRLGLVLFSTPTVQAATQWIPWEV